MLYRIRRFPLPPLFSPPVSLEKSWLLATSFSKISIENFSIKISSKKIFLIFLFIRYDTAIIKQSFSYFFSKNFLIRLPFNVSMKLAKAILFCLLLVHLII